MRSHLTSIKYLITDSSRGWRGFDEQIIAVLTAILVHRILNHDDPSTVSRGQQVAAGIETIVERMNYFL